MVNRKKPQPRLKRKIKERTSLRPHTKVNVDEGFHKVIKQIDTALDNSYKKE